MLMIKLNNKTKSTGLFLGKNYVTKRYQTIIVGNMVEWFRAPFYNHHDGVFYGSNLTMALSLFFWKMQFAATCSDWRIATTSELNESSLLQSYSSGILEIGNFSSKQGGIRMRV